ncbi:MFS transporter [Musicola paradisiaca]|nr:MFS transporter [Musicola paradisiaca]
MDKNISPAFILALISSVFFYLSDSQIILKFYEMGLTKSDYGYAMSLSGLSGVVAGFFISKSVLNANIKNILSCLIFRGLGYFLIPASSYAEDIFHIPREYIMYFAMIVMGGAVSINSILLSTYVQYFSSKDNTAKSTSMISSSIGFAMFSAPPVGSFITYYLGLNACFLATSAGILFMVVIFLIKKKDKVERVLI